MLKKDRGEKEEPEMNSAHYRIVNKNVSNAFVACVKPSN